MTLYRKELVRILKSLIFLLVAGGIVVFIYSQGVFPPESAISKPEQGAQDYGMKKSDNPELIMPEAAESLFGQYAANQYVTYPNGFIKYVRLNEADREKMGSIIAELSLDGASAKTPHDSDAPDTDKNSFQIEGDQFQSEGDGSFKVTISGDDIPSNTAQSSFAFDATITWERFSELMERADALLGGGSDFSQTWISHRFGQIPVTYEEALADYELTVSSDRLTGAHARLFSDYAGIILGLLPVFLAAFHFLGDRKNISPLLYTRRVSSPRFVLSRYGALVTAVMLPVLLMCAILTVIHIGDYGLGNIDMLAYFKYALGWMLPTAMASTAVGIFFTVLTGTPVAIAVQLVWWFTDTMGGSGAYSFFGVRPLQLAPRHNGLGSTGEFIEYLPELIQNRIWIALIAVILVALTVLVFEIKRKGGLHAPVLKSGRVQPEI